ncbi:MAG: hypothetical protein JWP96_636 [Polaromonas sp.]|nr:hypothetical protein [Polaromonas sp.]
MAAIRWQDIKADSGRWLGLQVEVADGVNPRASRKPDMRLETCFPQRIKLMQGSVTLLWATVCEDYYGVRILKSMEKFTSAIPPGAMDSALIERLGVLDKNCRLPAWSRFFAQTLAAASAGAFLHPGLWFFKAAPSQKGRWSFGTDPEGWGLLHSWHIEAVQQALDKSAVGEVAWGFHENRELVCLRPPVPADDGRLKWWRKKVREQTLPPILIWYLSCFDAYVLIDGHCRLQACILEKQPPDFLIAFSAEKQPVEHEAVAQEQIIASLHNPHKPLHRRLSTEAANAVLIKAFDDRPLLLPNTHGWASFSSEDQWLGEVNDKLKALGRAGAFQDFANRSPL